MASWARLFTAIILGLVAGLLSADIENTPQVMTQTQLAKATQKYGMLAERRFHAWQALVDENLHKSEGQKLEAVNDFFNQAQFVDDIIHWGQKDYWATPIEFLGTDAGDCEDFTIAKYFTLKALGIPEHKLYLTYVKAIRLKQAHMVLTYFETPKSIPLVLDNI
ncbi:MAG: transglutaminase-like cysteine peptidase, partial [Gammaproteobacteria bacterium]|nr:transglutaminase-like cysteine peptidase [Gammaproteobacteria bacterium]